MKYFRMFIVLLFIFQIDFARAQSAVEGLWYSEDSEKPVRISEFDGRFTFSTTSFYANGAPVNWFFSYTLAEHSDIEVGEVISGRVRSVDSYYDCVFDEEAHAQLQIDGSLKIHYPILTYHRETRSVRDRDAGYYHKHRVDWTYWGWVETHYGFPIERYRVISQECVIDQRNWITNRLIKMQ